MTARSDGDRGPAAGRRTRDHRRSEEGGAADLGADGRQTGDGHQHRLRLQTARPRGGNHHAQRRLAGRALTLMLTLSSPLRLV